MEACQNRHNKVVSAENGQMKTAVKEVNVSLQTSHYMTNSMWLHCALIDHLPHSSVMKGQFQVIIASVSFS